SLGGLYLLRPDGSTRRYSEKDGMPNRRVFSVLEDSQGLLWVGTWKGLCRVAADDRWPDRIVYRVFTTRNGLPGDWIRTLFQLSNGNLFAGTQAGLAEWANPSGNRIPDFHSYTIASGFLHSAIL